MSLSYDKKDKNIEVVVFAAPEEFVYHIPLDTTMDKKRLISRIEREIRSSMEYSDYIAFLRQNVGMDACAYFNNVNKKINKKVRIEVHHAPLTLYDIVKLVLDKMMQTGEEINDLLIAERVTEIHYKNQVGLIPLSKTLHEVIHNSDKLIIPMYMIFGNYIEFLKEYEDVLELEENRYIRDKIAKLVEVTKSINEHSFDVLEAKFTYIKVDGFEVPVKIEDEEEISKAVSIVA